MIILQINYGPSTSTTGERRQWSTTWARDALRLKPLYVFSSCEHVLPPPPAFRQLNDVACAKAQMMLVESFGGTFSFILFY
jgi:hypothetical protein